MTAESKPMSHKANHPWAPHMASLTDLDLGALVAEISDVSAARKKLADLSAAYSNRQDQMSDAAKVAEVLGQLSIREVNGPALSCLSLDNPDGLTGKIIQFISEMPVSATMDILGKFLGGAGEFQVTLSNQCQVKIQIQGFKTSGEGHSCLCIVSRVAGGADNTRSSSLLAGGFEAISGGVIVINLNEEIIFQNKEAAKILLSRGLRTAQKIREILTADSYTVFSRSALEVKQFGGFWNGELRMAGDPAGQAQGIIGVLMSYFTYEDSGGEQGAILIQLRGEQNIPTPDHSATEELTRLAAVGRIASQIIHEINNPVTVINGKAEKIQWILDGVGSESSKKDINDCTLKILGMTERIGKIIKGMKNLTRNAQGEAKAPVSAAEIVREVIDLVDVVAKKSRVKLSSSEIDPALKLPMQRLRISQVIVNLANNAVEAVKAMDDRWIEIAFSSDDRWGYFFVTDSGSGLAPEVKGRLFETYFSTKGAGQGTGIGLSLARSIAREHGGDLYLDDDCRNTRFVVKLPLKAG